MTEKPNIEVTLLSPREVEGKSKILQKVGTSCNRPYWISEPSLFNNWNDAYGFFFSVAASDNWNDAFGLSMTSSGALTPGNVIYGYGVRPVLKSDNLEELIKNLKKTYENDIEVVEYGQYPDLEAKVDIPDNVNLKLTDKIYYYPSKQETLLGKVYSLNDYPEYEYNDQKFIYRNGTYYSVKPVKFYVDRENSMLISKNILFDSPISIDKKDYDGHFETSQLYDFLNNEFIKTLMSDNINDKDIVDMYEDLIQKLESEKQRLEDLIQKLESEKQRLEDLIQREKELLKRIIRALNLENEVLDAKIEDQILSKENKGYPKTYHL